VPPKNHFQHQRLTADQPEAPWNTIAAAFPAQPGERAFKDSIERFISSIEGRLDALWLVHGTFVGNDALGIFGQIERAIPALGPTLKLLGKNLTDALAGDTGNFSKRFVEQISGAVPVNRFTWSGENSHSGRCKAAIELLAAVIEQVETRPRVLLWGHSHAGNIAALVTNLIGAEPWCRDAFLELVEPLFPPSNNPKTEPTALEQVRAGFAQGKVREIELDIVNFGTPISYGWDSGGYRRLMHVVNHRPTEGQPPWLCPPVKVAGRWLFSNTNGESSPTDAGSRNEGQGSGDMIQILGIAGSEFLPWLLDKSTRDCESALQKFIAPGNERNDYIRHASIGARVANEGVSVLVDYENTNGLAAATMGHSIYTRSAWLGFHCDLVRESLYSNDASDQSTLPKLTS
jgi:hypothetical protein